MPPSSILAIALLAAVPQAPPHPTGFWQDIAAHKYELPAGTSAQQLVPELLANLGSSDPVLRDDLSYSILTAWIYEKKLLAPDDLVKIVRTLEGNLTKGIGGAGDDGVLLRSFSALTLSVIAARDNEAPFLTSADYQHLVDAALTYFHDERDLRGYDARKGWMHSAAHTSDLLKFLARNPRLAPADQGRILGALLAKNRDAAVSFVQGEDERMARVMISIVRRTDFDRDGFRTWLGSAAAAAKFPDPAGVDALRAEQNVRHLLTALWTALSADPRPSDTADAARQMLLETLKKLF